MVNSSFWLVSALLLGSLTAAPAAAQTVAQTAAESDSYTTLFVHVGAGSDAAGDGSQRRPYATITHALRQAPINSIIVLAPGEYSRATGEHFPLQLKQGVTVQGMPTPGQSQVVIVGGGSYLSPSMGLHNITVLGADGAGLGNVTVINPTPAGQGLWIETGSPVIRENSFIGSGRAGIYIAGAGAPIIQGNYFSENGQAGLIVAGPSQAQITGNLFERTGIGIRVAPGATPVIQENRIVRNHQGLLLEPDARPALGTNTIVQNQQNAVVEMAAAPRAVQTVPPEVVTFAASEAEPAPDAAVLPTSVAPAAAAPEPEPTATTTAAAPDSPTAATTATAPLPEAELPTVDAGDATTADVAPLSAPLHSIPAPVAALEPLPPAEGTVAESPIPAATSAPEETASVETPAEAPAEAAPIGSGPELDTAIAFADEADAIEIEVVPPELPAAESADLPTVTVANHAELAPLDAESLPLRVPDFEIPMGSGGLQTISSPVPATGPPAPPSRAAALGLRYRVLVGTPDAADQAALRQVVTDAFRVRGEGDTLMQAGAYPDQETANALVEELRQHGFDAWVDTTF